jgi:23S rRNA pseudouridine2605 synthase
MESVESDAKAEGRTLLRVRGPLIESPLGPGVADAEKPDLKAEAVRPERGSPMPLDRLHKVLAHAGFGSRRKCEQLIREGMVQVDGKTVTEMGVKVDVDRQKIKCEGRYLRPERKVVYVLNKPKRIICTTRDERGRRSVVDLMHGVRERVYPVGRLDAASQGLVVMTNDGELCNRLTHPRYGVARTYHVVVAGEVTGEVIEKLNRGVWLSEGKTGPLKVEIRKRDHGLTVLEATIHEGMNREIRRVFARFGLEVERLKRIKIGDFNLSGLPEGHFRPLNEREIEMLFAGVRVGDKPPPKNPEVKQQWVTAKKEKQRLAAERAKPVEERPAARDEEKAEKSEREEE